MIFSYITEHHTAHTCRSTQAVVYGDNGKPVALIVTHGGFIIITDVTKPDFQKWCSMYQVSALSDDEMKKIGLSHDTSVDK